jgi:DNA-binding TFAR19-related protein (PDSD5 family)
MSEDSELEKLKHQRFVEMQKRITARQHVANPKEKLGPRQILERVFVGRAWEVYHAARAQYPGIADQVFQELAELVQSGKLRTKITGEQLFGLLRQIGLDVRLDTKIQVLEHGELKSIADKFRGP